MPSATRTVFTLVALLLVAGCAEVKFYKSSDLREDTRTGIPFYVAKPYLLVARTGAKDKPVDVSVIYLPDLSKPLYARLAPGLWGSSDLSMSFSNSIVTAVGQKTDTKIPELLTSLGGLQTSLATAAKTRAETGLLGNESAPDYGAASKQLRRIGNDLKAQVDEARAGKFLTENELGVLAFASTAILAAADSLADPTKAESTLAATLASLAMAAKNWDGQVREASAATTGNEPVVRRQISALRKELQTAIDGLSPKPGEPATFTLYDIEISNGVTTLKEVKF
ncbi:hypothetical protein [Variovorax fucosicus]|uniref:hypothetical protein n=1 Tax=Variovorax fucosicus TaxID=3053517 RepID=UPI00257544F1|nr:hypothetical protein [Variovorax sp. J22G47]MDM0059015.1 hypothetical protein [Variovorax sp. J22G47]